MSSNQDDTLLPSSRSSTKSGELKGDTVVPQHNVTGIHVPGDVIDNRYTVIREIGRGGMGVVYEVEDAITGDRYAVKRLLPAFASRPEIIQQFRTEGAASIRFTNQSRHFVSTQTVGLDNGQPYIVMQLIAHPTLRTLLNQSGGRLAIETALPILGAIAIVLAELHDFGFIHRDLKPENIFVDQQASTPRVMLVDFGLTKDGSDATATALKFGGTERYASPEQKKGLTTTSASDIYSFGVIAFEVLAGELPGVGDTLSDFVDDVPGQVATIVMQCLATRPERRPQNALTLSSTFVRIQPSEIHVELAELTNEDLIAQPSQPIELLTSTISFPDLQTDALVVIDGDLILAGGDYACELLPGTSKSLDVVVSWEGVHLFQDSVHLVAGESKTIPTQKAYRIDCDVPEWCEVKDAYAKPVRFPVTGITVDDGVPLLYSLNYQGREFDKVSLTTRPGQQKVTIPFGIGTVQTSNIPPQYQVWIADIKVTGNFTIPIKNGSRLTLRVRICEGDGTEVTSESLLLKAQELKSIQLPINVQETSSPKPTSGSSEGASGPEKISGSDASKKTITRRIMIGGAVVTGLGCGAWYWKTKRGEYLPTIISMEKGLEADMRFKFDAGARKARRDYPELSRYLSAICLIPSGQFSMGGTFEADQMPIHRVSLSSFALGATPVTVALWKEYCGATGAAMPDDSNFIPWQFLDNHPIVHVDMDDIMGADSKGGFCAWASDIAGFRMTLPTEAQWEYAARGGVAGLEFPWGNSFDNSKLWCSKDTNRFLTAPVNRSSNIYRNKYGLTDMVGNVQQWCLDQYAPYSSSLQTDPVGRSSFGYSMLRGGCWDFNDPEDFRCAKRYEQRFYLGLGQWIHYNGFRLCAGES
jgi:serine/threonine protein kinase/formylglycine-generating enzyme required for sulfatase activity